MEGLDISPEVMKELLSVDAADWTAETEKTGAFFEIFGKRLPEEIREEQAQLGRRLDAAGTARE